MKQLIARLLILALVALASQLSVVMAETTYFVVAELPGFECHGDSYVLPLTNTADIAHARALISEGPQIGEAIVVAGIAAGADGINRDYLKNPPQDWSWHVTEFVAFADMTIEILDGWPTYVESDVNGWINITGGFIGFWGYTVVDEFPPMPEISVVAIATNELLLTLSNLSISNTVDIQSSGDLMSNTWVSVDTFTATAPTANLSISATNAATKTFYRVSVQK